MNPATRKTWSWEEKKLQRQRKAARLWQRQWLAELHCHGTTLDMRTYGTKVAEGVRAVSLQSLLSK
jgi:hypothetical protein